MKSNLQNHFATTFANFLPAQAASDGWNELLNVLRKHGLLETLVHAPFSKIGFDRVPLQINRSRVHDPEHLTHVSEFLARELTYLVDREVDASSVHLLASLPIEKILEALRALPLNRSTGKGISDHFMTRTVEDILDGSPEITRIMDSLDDRFATIGRVIARDADHAAIRLEERANRSFETAQELLRLSQRVYELETANGEHTAPNAPQLPALCLSCDVPHKRTRDELVEEQCKRYLKNNPEAL